MTKGSIALAIVILLAVNFTAVAQDEERDVVEMTFFGGFGIPGSGVSEWVTQGYERAAETGFDMGLEAGWFVRSNFVVGVNITYTEFGIDDTAESSHNHRLYNPSIYAKLLFEGESNWTPYLKGHLGLDNAKFSTKVTNPAGGRYREISYEPAIAMGVGAGLIYYTAYYSALFIEVNYHTAMTEKAEATYLDTQYEFGENLATYDIHAGIRLVFSKD
ncbi:MAG: hypothetical protein ABII79_11915 [bacterium]